MIEKMRERGMGEREREIKMERRERRRRKRCGLRERYVMLCREGRRYE